jgi:hypothetical protein
MRQASSHCGGCDHSIRVEASSTSSASPAIWKEPRFSYRPTTAWPCSFHQDGSHPGRVLSIRLFACFQPAGEVAQLQSPSPRQLHKSTSRKRKQNPTRAYASSIPSIAAFATDSRWKRSRRLQDCFPPQFHFEETDFNRPTARRMRFLPDTLGDAFLVGAEKTFCLF